MEGIGKIKLEVFGDKDFELKQSIGTPGSNPKFAAFKQQHAPVFYPPERV